jgi:DNA polymerase III delta subunit
MIRVCTSANEYDAFAFTNAIMSGNADRALAILEDYRFRRVEPLFILGEVTRVISEMLVVQSMLAEGAPTAEISSAFKPPLHEYRIGLYRQALRQTDEKRIRRALDACVAADASLKFSLGSKGYEPLEKLVCTI